MQKHILIALPLQEFETLIRDCIKSELQVEKKVQPEPAVEYIAPKEAAAMLRISLPTLRKYTRSSLFKQYRIGSAIRYRRQEIEKSLSSIHAIKHSRERV